MGPTKIMIIRHAEKPGIYNKVLYNGINAVGKQDPASLVTMGWERAGGVANLFYPDNNLAYPTNGNLLAMPDYIYASNPVTPPPSPPPYSPPPLPPIEPNGNIIEDEVSQRPYQTISALYAKMQSVDNGSMPPPKVILNGNYAASNYAGMVMDVLGLETSASSLTVLIAWQHQDILPHPLAKPPITDSIINELFYQTGTISSPNTIIPTNFNVPPGQWPASRYDMVFVLDRPSGKGAFTTSSFTQVPQLLLAGDSNKFFSPDPVSDSID